MPGPVWSRPTTKDGNLLSNLHMYGRVGGKRHLPTRNRPQEFSPLQM